MALIAFIGHHMASYKDDNKVFYALYMAGQLLVIILVMPTAAHLRDQPTLYDTLNGLTPEFKLNCLQSKNKPPKLSPKPPKQKSIPPMSSRETWPRTGECIEKYYTSEVYSGVYGMWADRWRNRDVDNGYRVVSAQLTTLPGHTLNLTIPN